MKVVTDQAVAAMRPLVIFGVMLIAIGIAGVTIDNISFKRKEVVIAADPFNPTAEQQRGFPFLSVAGVIAIAVGGGMVFVDRRRNFLPSEAGEVSPSHGDGGVRES